MHLETQHHYYGAEKTIRSYVDRIHGRISTRHVLRLFRHLRHYYVPGMIRDMDGSMGPVGKSLARV